jgi:hypothetical protein
MTISEGGTRRGRSPLGTVLVVVAVQLVMVLVLTLATLTVGSEDTDVYFHYIAMALRGEVPYRDFSLEYPPLALMLFVVPALIGRSLQGFKLAFAVEMLLFNAVTVWLVASWVAERQGSERVWSRLAWYTVFLMVLSRLVVCRFDAAPMLLGFAAATWWFSGRSRLGGVAAALGALLKVYPALIAAVAAAWDLAQPRRDRGRGLIGFVLTTMLGVAAWLALGGIRGVSRSLGYQLDLSMAAYIPGFRCWPPSSSVRRSSSCETTPRGLRSRNGLPSSLR